MSVHAEVDGLDDGPLGRLALSRSTVDRATQRRADTEWIEAAWADPRSRVIVVYKSQALTTQADGRPELVFVAPADAPEGTRFFLGLDADEVAYFGVAATVEGEAWDRSPESDVKPAHLRQVGAALSDRDAGLLTHAVALANWHETHTHCPQCGAATVPAPAGHLTVCPVDGTEHFPRLDPAVIMLVIDADDRLLLARNALWPKGRMSVVAGFVEPGESAEHAVAREVFEETAITVGQVTYLGSQPWPMPRSLMLGYQAMAKSGQSIAVDEDEIGEARWFSRAELRAAIDAGDLGIAPTSSIARRLIEHWYGAELPDGPASWTAPAR
ncbi:MAG: NAD(+) diphosphatase [Trebonia sp.]